MDIKGFISNLEARAYSPKTVRAYEREIVHFRKYLREQRLRLTQVTPKVVLTYVTKDTEHSCLGTASKRRTLSALSSFFEYRRLISDNRTRNPVSVIHPPKRQPPRRGPIDDRVLDQLVAAITNKRDRALIVLMRSSGLRLSELLSLNRDSIAVESESLAAGVQRVLGVGRVIGKGNRERQFLVDIHTIREIHEYLKARGEDGLAPLFLSNRKTRLSPRNVQYILERWCKRAGIPRIHPHSLRHSAATRWHRLGLGTLEIAQLLGHRSVTTTELYIRPDLSRIRAEYFAAMESVSGASEKPAAKPRNGSANPSRRRAERRDTPPL